MKKILAVLLCCLLTACTGQAALPDPVNPLETSALTALRAAGPENLQADTDETEMADSHRSVRMTADLLDQMADLLAAHPLTVEEMDFIGGNQIEELMIQGQAGDQPLVIELFGCGPQHYLYPDQTVIWIQLGEETCQYLTAGTLFDEMKTLVTANIYEERVTLSKGSLPLTLSQKYGEIRAEGLQLEGELYEFDNMILAGLSDSSSGTGLQLEGMLLADGRSLYSITEPAAFALQPLPSPVGLYDYTLYTASGLVLRSSHNTQMREEYPLLENITALMTRRRSGNPDYHVNLAGNQVVVAGEEGVWLCDNLGASEPRLLLDNGELPKAMEERYPEGVPQDMQFYYCQPRILGGGTAVVAAIANPGSQSEKVGLAVHSLTTGETTYYLDVFSAMRAEVTYPDDNMVAAWGSELTLIDSTGTQETRRISVSALAGSAVTRDHVVTLKSDLDAAGEPTYELRSAPVGTPRERTALLTATGNHFYLVGATPSAAVCGVSDMDGDRLVLVPLT